MPRPFILSFQVFILSLIFASVFLGTGFGKPFEATLVLETKNISIGTRIGNPNLTFALENEFGEDVQGAAGYLTMLAENKTLYENNGSYYANLTDVSAGTYDIVVRLQKEGYHIPELRTTFYLEYERIYQGYTNLTRLSGLSFTTDRPEVCTASFNQELVEISVVYDKSRIPVVHFHLVFPEPLDLSRFDLVRINISHQNCPSLQIGLQDDEGSKTMLTLDTDGDMDVKWKYREATDWVNFKSISKLVFQTMQRRDGKNHRIALESLEWVRNPRYIHQCPPTLKDALQNTLSHRADPIFVHGPTGLPFEFINLYEYTVPSVSELDMTIGNNEIGEGLTSFWMYYLGSGEKWVEEFLRQAAVAEARYLDPGDGLIGLHHYYRRTGELDDDTHNLRGCKFRGGPAGESSAQHGAEEAMYMMLPAAWILGEEEALHALERYSETLLQLNSEPDFLHLHLYVKKCNGEWYVGDWNGMHDQKMEVVDPDPSAFTDLSEFWWITPMLGTAILTENQTLRTRIIDRCRPILDNVIQYQAVNGEIPFVYTLDGSRAIFNATAKGWSGYNVNSFYARSAYLMHNLTGDEKYLHSLERMYDFFLQDGTPGSYRFAPQIIFHSLYTGNETLASRLVQDIRSRYTLDRIEHSILDCTWRLLPWIFTGNLTDLQIALRGESRFRTENWLEIPGGSGRYHYYPPYVVDTIVEWGWCPLDKFGSGIEDFYALSQLGPSSMGLVERDLLTMGFLARIPDCPVISLALLAILGALLNRNRSSGKFRGKP